MEIYPNISTVGSWRGHLSVMEMQKRTEQSEIDIFKGPYKMVETKRDVWGVLFIIELAGAGW